MTSVIISAFLPVFAVISLGWAIHASGYVPRSLWRGVNALNHRVLLPCFLFSLLTRAELGGDDSLSIAAASGLGSGLMTGLALITARLLHAPNSTYAPLIGTAVMWNIVLTLALANRLLGDSIGSVAAAVAATGVIVGAAATVTAFALSNGKGLRAALLKTLRDPVVIACVLGLIANGIGMGHWPGLTLPFEMIGAGSMAVILMAMGAGLDFSALKGRLAILFSAAALRTVLGPVVYLGLSITFGLKGDVAVLMAMAGAAPTAAFIYAVAADFETEAGLTAGMITLTVLMSVITLPMATAFALSL